MKDIKEFQISFSDVTLLPYELYSIDYIWEELKKHEEVFGPLEKMEHATKTSIKKYYRDQGSLNNNHSRHFAYIKFCYDYEDKKCYGLVGGKTNYTYPDLNFDELNNQFKKDNRYARNFLNQKGIKWAETIIIVNHKPSTSEETDKQEALFLECYLQRRFNLFDS